MSRRSALSIALALAVSMSALAQSGDASRGQQKSQVCQSCHGSNGNEPLMPNYPRLAGQHEDYLAHALRSYRDGSRNNAVMAGFAAGLSDQDIADLAAWYASQDGLVDLSID